MAITQINIVKNLPYIVSNMMALLTCLPIAIGVVAFGKSFISVFDNKALVVIGAISYEIYLVHAFTLDIVGNGIGKIIIFVVITIVLAMMVNRMIRKIKV